VARTWAVLAVVPERSRKPKRIGREWGGCGCKTALADPLAEFVLCRADLGQQRHRIETAIGLAQPPLDGLGKLWVSQRSLVRRHWYVIALDDLCALATLLFELEGWPAAEACVVTGSERRQGSAYLPLVNHN
jgi:hypothetical protein